MRPSTSFANPRSGSLNVKIGDFASLPSGQFPDRFTANNRPIPTGKQGSFKPIVKTKFDVNTSNTSYTKPTYAKKPVQKSTTHTPNPANSQILLNSDNRHVDLRYTSIYKSSPAPTPHHNSAYSRLHSRNQSQKNNELNDDENPSINKIPYSPISIKRAMSPQMSLGIEEGVDDENLYTESSISDISRTKASQCPRLITSSIRKKESIDPNDPRFQNQAQRNRSILYMTSPCGLDSMKSLNDINDSNNSTIFGPSLKDIDAAGSKENATNSLEPNYGLKRDSLFSTLPYRSMTDVNQSNKISPTKIMHSFVNIDSSQGIMRSPGSLRRNPMEFSLKTRSPHFDNIERTSLKSSVTTLHSSPKARMTSSQREDSRSNSTIEGVKAYFSKLNNKFDISISSSIKQIFQPKKRLKCSCDIGLDEDQTCSKAIAWIQKKYSQNEFEYLRSTYEKILSENKLVNVEHSRQIQKDLHRTYPQNKFFGEDSPGIKALERILNTFAKYDPQIGYVQGMNFIAASLMYHAEEYIAFWLLVMIFEIFEMRDIYLPRLPGLSKHCQIIEMLIFNYQHSIYSHLCRHSIRVDVFCTEWILALFASVVPVENMANFYDMLLGEGWPFFYKIILAFLQQFERQIKEQDDLMGILTVLKSQNHIIKNSTKDKNNLTLDWNNLFQKAQKIEIDSHFVYKMHSNFDVDNQWFRTSFLENH